MRQGVLAGMVWKAFERVEAHLNGETKLEIAIWLLSLKPLSPSLQGWPGTFAAMFDRVFGEKHLTVRCFIRSAIVSYIAVFILGVYVDRAFGWLSSFRLIELREWIRWGFVSNVVPDYVSLLETRYIFSLVQRTRSSALQFVGVFVDLILTTLISLLTAHIILSIVWELSWSWTPSAILNHPLDYHQQARWLTIMIPAFLTSIWLWLYAGSGLILKAARRFDIGFGWFNRRFDIEKKPLQCVGLVAGAIVALAYLVVVMVLPGG